MLAVLPLFVLFTSAAPDAGATLEDFDHDGVPDIEDDCPTDPGNAKNKGCPGEVKVKVEKPKPGTVEVKNDRIDIKDTVLFRTGSASVDPKSFGLLKEIAESIKTVPAGKKIVIAGHTDDRGSHDSNVKLSKARAEAVIAHLVHDGIARDRLGSEGHGPDKPIASNKTEDGRSKNRRVEFLIVDPQ
jgi:outer membrane protein OmpA-like peptidoglycan-associated protein